MNKHPENTPIYDATVNDAASVNDEPTPEPALDPAPEPAWIFTSAGRRWLYSIAAALLVVVGGYLGIDAAQQESWLSLVGAILNIGGAGALTYANRKVG